jgi:hypothetical protein
VAKVIFIFSHAVLVRTWQKAKALLADERIELVVTSQTAPMDWPLFVREEAACADALYLDVTRHFPTFEPLVALVHDSISGDSDPWSGFRISLPYGSRAFPVLPSCSGSCSRLLILPAVLVVTDFASQVR